MIWLLRHAHAAPGHPDETRRLTGKGLTQARAVGLALQRLGVTLDTCLSSPKTRALDTARLACEPLGLEVTVEPALAGAPFLPASVAAGHGDVLLVGHDPSITQALHDATGARAPMRKGGLAAIDGDRLVLLLTPAELGAIAGIELDSDT
jgi:phosphohistidine phosphatase